MFLDNIALKPKLLGGFGIMIVIAVIISFIGLIYTHVLNRGPTGVRCPMDSL